MNNSPNIEVCLEYLIKIDSKNSAGALLEDSNPSKFSVTEKDASGSRITVKEYWREREEFQKSVSYSALLNHYDGGTDEFSFEPIKITFWDPMVGQFSVWF